MNEEYLDKSSNRGLNLEETSTSWTTSAGASATRSRVGFVCGTSSGHLSSGSTRNAGPFNERLSEVIASALRPRLPSSAGLSLPGQWRHGFGSEVSRISESLLAMKAG